MKAHINEYDRMVMLQDQVDELAEQSQILTDKIEKHEHYRVKYWRNAAYQLKDFQLKTEYLLLTDFQSVIYQRVKSWIYALM